MVEVRPGDTVEYTQTFRGVVVKVREKHIHIRNRKFTTTVFRDQIVKILDPLPDEGQVVSEINCHGCGAISGELCMHKQTGKAIKHPHRERIDLWVKVTGWTPNGVSTHE